LQWPFRSFLGVNIFRKCVIARLVLDIYILIVYIVIVIILMLLFDVIVSIVRVVMNSAWNEYLHHTTSAFIFISWWYILVVGVGGVVWRCWRYSSLQDDVALTHSSASARLDGDWRWLLSLFHLLWPWTLYNWSIHTVIIWSWQFPFHQLTTSPHSKSTMSLYIY